MAPPERIPVFLLSGFLGSGKSTLLNAFLTDPNVQDTAVVINEFGDVPVDHLLVRHGETQISQVSTGCLCCSDTTDIRKVLDDLRKAKLEGVTGRFSRVIVEMSGLGDPAPLVNALSKPTGADSQRPEDTSFVDFYLAGVVTLFDAVAGGMSIENHFEALKQIAFADRIVLTKTDLVTGVHDRLDAGQLAHELRELNLGAEIVDRQAVNFSSLFSPRPYSEIERGEDVAGWLALEAALALEAHHGARSEMTDVNRRHGAGISTFSIVHDKALSQKKFDEFLTLLRKSAGHRLLRVKGIVATEETPDEPLIVHAVQHTVSSPVRLSSWPDDDRRTRLVFITDGIDPAPVRDLFSVVINREPFSFRTFVKNAVNAARASFLRTFPCLTRLSRRP
ncbi:GTP-binding protein [Labrenzia sp. CE80]|uniref:CobW family GTP-binding protein n=1 Tax=Labrenzia sp. CE80 TaxID=1788986 RepID=UPI00129B1A90|nr:GTP-binding protein [Labrenzia sp. CE80]